MLMKMSKYIATLLLILCFGYSHSQTKLNESNFKKSTSKGVVVVEFNAPFNVGNSFKGWRKLEHCSYYTVCVAGSPTLQKKYKIRSYPTLLIFHNGYVEKKFKGNIMLELEVTTKELQEAVDELYLDKF